MSRDLSDLNLLRDSVKKFIRSHYKKTMEKKNSGSKTAEASIEELLKATITDETSVAAVYQHLNKDEKDTTAIAAFNAILFIDYARLLSQNNNNNNSLILLLIAACINFSKKQFEHNLVPSTQKKPSYTNPLFNNIIIEKSITITPKIKTELEGLSNLFGALNSKPINENIILDEKIISSIAFLCLAHPGAAQFINFLEATAVKDKITLKYNEEVEKLKQKDALKELQALLIGRYDAHKSNLKKGHYYYECAKDPSKQLTTKKIISNIERDGVTVGKIDLSKINFKEEVEILINNLKEIKNKHPAYSYNQNFIAILEAYKTKIPVKVVAEERPLTITPVPSSPPPSTSPPPTNTSTPKSELIPEPSTLPRLITTPPEISNEDKTAELFNKKKEVVFSIINTTLSARTEAQNKKRASNFFYRFFIHDHKGGHLSDLLKIIQNASDESSLQKNYENFIIFARKHQLSFRSNNKTRTMEILLEKIHNAHISPEIKYFLWQGIPGKKTTQSGSTPILSNMPAKTS